MPPPDDMPEKLVKAFSAFMEIGWLMPLVGIAEIVGGVLFLVPKTRALGALILFPLIVGILLTSTVTEPSGLPLALGVVMVELWVIYENRQKYLPMIS